VPEPAAGGEVGGEQLTRAVESEDASVGDGGGGGGAVEGAVETPVPSAHDDPPCFLARDGIESGEHVAGVVGEHRDRASTGDGDAGVSQAQGNAPAHGGRAGAGGKGALPAGAAVVIGPAKARPLGGGRGRQDGGAAQRGHQRPTDAAAFAGHPDSFGERAESTLPGGIVRHHPNG
jgi:hypothetical protein